MTSVSYIIYNKDEVLVKALHGKPKELKHFRQPYSYCIALWGGGGGGRVVVGKNVSTCNIIPILLCFLYQKM